MEPSRTCISTRSVAKDNTTKGQIIMRLEMHDPICILTVLFEAFTRLKWLWGYIFVPKPTTQFQILDEVIYVSVRTNDLAKEISSCRAIILSCDPSLSSIASGTSSELHSESAQSWCMWVLARLPAFARLCEGVHRCTSLIRLSLLLQQSPACLVRLTLIVFVLDGKWPYSCCFVGYCLQDLFSITRSIPCRSGGVAKYGISCWYLRRWISVYNAKQHLIVVL